jgi:hypothetical protein
MSLNPTFDQFPTEAALIGRMVTSFGELELTFGMIAGTAIRDQALALRAIYRGRSTGGRIDLADVLIRNRVANSNLAAEYDEVLGAMRHCLKIRNNYAHCHWAPGQDGLFFTNLEEAAGKANGFDTDQKHVDLNLLSEQEAYFNYTRDLLLYFGDQTHHFVQPQYLLGVAKPSKKDRPKLHNQASQHIPHWLSGDAKKRHFERALEAGGRAPPPERPPSIPRLTEEEWLAKYRKEGKRLPDGHPKRL